MASEYGTQRSKAFRCWHCGFLSDRVFQTKQPDRQADVIHVVSTPASELRRGDLIVIRTASGQSHVKRVFALAGDVVEATADGSLEVAGKSTVEFVQSIATRIPVDLDAFRVGDGTRTPSNTDDNLTRWRCEQSRPGETARWIRDTATKQWMHSAVSTEASSDDIDWLVYGHRNVHRGHLASRVLDDYPGNVDASRRLFPVPAIQLGGVSEDAMAGMLVAQWTSDGIRIHGGRRILSPAEAWDKIGRASPPVSAEHPIAVGCVSARSVEGGAIGPLRVERPVHFRVVPDLGLDDQVGEIPNGHLYVLGDNVPMSSDSRQNGPIPYEAVVGVVEQPASASVAAMADVIQPPPITRVPS